MILKLAQVLAKVVQKQRWVLVHEVEYEQLDDLRIQGITRASKKCRKLMMGNIDWSPTAQVLREVILFWKLFLRRAQGCRVSRSYHRRVQKKANLLDVEVPLMIDALISILKASILTWKKFAKDEADKARDTFMETLAEAQPEIDGGGDAATKLKQLRSQEKKRRTATCIKAARGELGGSGVSSISYRLEDGKIKETMDRSSMEQCFIRANEANIKQAQDTSFMVEPMVSEVGWLGICPKVCQIPEGTYAPCYS
jgi:hypothetical protein